MNNKHVNNPDVRPAYQNKPQAGNAGTPPVPRSFRTAFPQDFLKTLHSGTMKYTYRGIPCLKNPFDLALYLKLIYELKPGTIIEIGSFNGGSAILFADVCRMYGFDTRIVSLDFRDVVQQKDPRIEYVVADAMHLDQSPLETMLGTLPRPWLVIEDSAHTFEVCHAVLEYFKDRLVSGEYLIIEDGVIEDQGGNHRYDGGPNRAVHTFFTEHPAVFRVDDTYTDFFGMNATFNPNGYLRKC